MQGNAGSPQIPVSSEHSTQALEAVIRASGKARTIPPVELWNPPLCGSIDIKITRDGTWIHQGRPIKRPALVKLFASVLRKDDDGVTYLVTPHEKLAVEVEDASLVVTGYEVRETLLDEPSDAKTQDADPYLVLRTSTDDEVVVGAEHSPKFVEDGKNGGLKIYVRVRGRLDALLNRAVTMALLQDERIADLDCDPPALRSGGEEFAIVPSKLAELR